MLFLPYPSLASSMKVWKAGKISFKFFNWKSTTCESCILTHKNALEFLCRCFAHFVTHSNLCFSLWTKLFYILRSTWNFETPVFWAFLRCLCLLAGDSGAFQMEKEDYQQVTEKWSLNPSFFSFWQTFFFFLVWVLSRSLALFMFDFCSSR